MEPLVLEQVVLMDLDRLRAIECPLSFAHKDGALIFHEPDEAYKFVIAWKRKVGPVLVIGPIVGHVFAYAAYLGQDLPVPEAKAQFATNTKFDFVKSVIERDMVIGAGNVDKDGKITSWGSQGFHVTTPASERTKIEAAIREIFDSGQLRLE